MEPHITLGILILGYQDILLLAANLYKHYIYIKKGQIIAYLYLSPLSNLVEVKEIGDLSKFNLLISSPVLLIISRSNLIGLSSYE